MTCRHAECPTPGRCKDHGCFHTEEGWQRVVTDPGFQEWAAQYGLVAGEIFTPVIRQPAESWASAGVLRDIEEMQRLRTAERAALTAFLEEFTPDKHMPREWVEFFADPAKTSLKFTATMRESITKFRDTRYPEEP